MISRFSSSLAAWATCGVLLIGCAVSEEDRVTPEPVSKPARLQVRIDPEQARVAREVIRLANVERAARGLRLLREQPVLQNAAVWMANDMAEHDSFNHTDSQGREPGRRILTFGYGDARLIAENIGKGADTPQAAVQGWLNSPPHRENLLHPDLREVGVGFAAKDRERYWVLDLGTRFDE